MRTRRKIWEKEQVNAIREVVKALLQKIDKDIKDVKEKIIDLDANSV